MLNSLSLASKGLRGYFELDRDHRLGNHHNPSHKLDYDFCLCHLRVFEDKGNANDLEKKGKIRKNNIGSAKKTKTYDDRYPSLNVQYKNPYHISQTLKQDYAKPLDCCSYSHHPS